MEASCFARARCLSTETMSASAAISSDGASAVGCSLGANGGGAASSCLLPRVLSLAFWYGDSW